MDKQSVLRDSNFGQRVAEEESDELEKYFVETDHWARTFRGEVDVIYGPKGSGKSALYSLLIRKQDELFDRGIVVVSGEKPRGAPAFKDIEQDPPTTEDEFVGLWKLYLVVLINSVLSDFGIQSPEANRVAKFLEMSGLVETRRNVSRALRGAFRYVKSFFRKPSAVEGDVRIDPATGLPAGFTGKITFAEPEIENPNVASVDSLLKDANEALTELRLWILLDRLDVAFAEMPTLEENALRALFRVYLDMMEFDRIDLKIFLRTDIWNRITSQGFREASHITRHITIKWDSSALMNLVVRRAMKNPAIVEAYSVDPNLVLSSSENQNRFFYRMFPPQVDIGSRKSTTFDWILNRTMDGTGKPAPREIIHLLNATRDAQLRQYELGSIEDEGEQLFSRAALREALPEVSRIRLQQTLYAEYPRVRASIEQLSGEKTEHSPDTLAKVWHCDANRARETAEQLTDVGFFERRGTKDSPRYWIPFLYRPATGTIQGSAEEEE